MSILVEEQNAIPLQESPENYLYFLTTVNPVDFISTSERGSKIVKLFSEHFLPLPFSSNEDGSDLTEETRVILLVPYLISLGTLQIRQDHSPNQPFNMELHQKNRKIQLKQAKEYFCKFLNLVLQYDQVNDDYLSWVLPHTMTRDDEEEQVSKSNKKQDKAFEQLMNDRSQMVLRMRAKNTLEKELFSNIEEMSELEISRLLSSVSLGEDSSKKVSEQVKKKMLNIRDYINFCILDTLEQLSSINREEEMLNAVSARPSMPQHPSQYQQQSSSTSGQPISHLKATSINDVLNNRGMLSQMGYNMILLPNNNGGNTSGNKSTNGGGNSLQKKALANQSIQSNIVNNRATREDIKSRVFGSYVPGPTVSLEEFARQECIDMHQREEKDKQFKQEQTQKKKDDEEEEDEEELKKKRVWDDWKDDHVKGAGNMRD